MRIFFSAFKSDIVVLTWWDLIKLACGRKVSAAGITVQRKLPPS
jgi:hypothetical protein